MKTQILTALAALTILTSSAVQVVGTNYDTSERPLSLPMSVVMTSASAPMRGGIGIRTTISVLVTNGAYAVNLIPATYTAYVQNSPLWTFTVFDTTNILQMTDLVPTNAFPSALSYGTTWGTRVTSRDAVAGFLFDKITGGTNTVVSVATNTDGSLRLIINTDLLALQMQIASTNIALQSQLGDASNRLAGAISILGSNTQSAINTLATTNQLASVSNYTTGASNALAITAATNAANIDISSNSAATALASTGLALSNTAATNAANIRNVSNNIISLSTQTNLWSTPDVTLSMVPVSGMTITNLGDIASGMSGWTNTPALSALNTNWASWFDCTPIQTLIFGSIQGVGPQWQTNAGWYYPRIRLAIGIYGKELALNLTHAAACGVRADGQAWTVVPMVNSANNLLHFQFTNNGPHRVEVTGFGLFFMSIYTPGTNAFFDIYPATSRLAIVGDSYINGNETDASQKLWPGILGDVFEPRGVNVITCACGGTGWSHPSTAGTFATLITNTLAGTFAPDYLCISGGINDSAVDTNTFYAAVTNTLAIAKTTFPSTRLFVVGPQSTSNYNAAINDKLAAQACSNASVPYQSVASWVNGGNALVLINAWGTHPSEAGQQYYATRLYNFVRTNIGLPR